MSGAKRSPRMEAAHAAIRRVLAGSHVVNFEVQHPLDADIESVTIGYADADELADQVLVALLPHFFCGTACPELESHGERRTGGLTDAR